MSDDQLNFDPQAFFDDYMYNGEALTPLLVVLHPTDQG